MATVRKEIHIREIAGIGRFGEYVRVAVPCARGELLPETPLGIIDPAEELQPCQGKVLKQWPDGSVKWLMVDCSVKVPAESTAIYRLAFLPDAAPLQAKSIQITSGANTWQVDTGAGVFAIDARTFRPFVMVRRQTGEVLRAGGSSCFLSTDGKSGVTPVVEDICLEDSGPLRAVVRMAGRFEMPEEEGLRFTSRLHFFAGSMAVKVEFTIYNPKAARHSGGLWDLGDPGSLQFKVLAFAFPFAVGTVTEVSCSPEIATAPIVNSGNDRLSIYQESSGGENWQSPNHRNREGRVPMTRRGYVIEVDGRQAASGLRASPIMWCGANGVGVAAALPHFWQEFPKAIEANNDHLTISLFPSRFADLHELQGGEQKTHTFYLDFTADRNSLAWALSPLRPVASPQDYRESGIFLDLTGQNDLIDQFSTAADICMKREAVDEYGWRNFGEIYADHEAVFHQGEDPFVSHYNNQYDFIAGAYRKFFATGDLRWREIAADMARHVRDIDIYHTVQDREEYNHGLFWHTDHYIDAELSSHRSFSREHLKKKDPRFCGGGPGPEHCYTTGLMLHYFQTGNPDFKQAVIDLTEWVLRALDGSRTVLAAVKRGAGYYSRWRTSRGSRRLFPRYPLTRGTGNALNACLDAFEVGGGRVFLDKAESLIRGALHPEDDIAARNLLDAEIAWSYTVLLVAVAKYLDKKQELGELDAGFDYARASLLAYAKWMLDNEYPYLEKPEILEYPNETWAAQDLRKSVIFFQASRYLLPEQREEFRQKGRFFFDQAREELLRHESSRFARPLVLMLQNGWVGSRLFDEGPQVAFSDYTHRDLRGQATPYLTLGSVLARIGSEVVHAMGETSVHRELVWLKARLAN